MMNELSATTCEHPNRICLKLPFAIAKIHKIT